jgi:hypothetical protein
MVVAGNTSLNNSSRTMEAFTFTSGIGGITCDAVPMDGLLVRMPSGAGIRFQVNSTDLALTGDAFMQADKNGYMTVTMLNGGGWMSSMGVAQFFKAGEAATVPLAGLKSNGPPSVKKSALGDMCLLTGTCGADTPTESSDNSVAMLQSAVPKIPTASPTSDASATHSPTRTRVPRTSTPRPTSTRAPTSTSTPTDTPVPTATPEMSSTPGPSSTPKPTKTPKNPGGGSTQEVTEEPTQEPTQEPTEVVTEEVPTCDKIVTSWGDPEGETIRFLFTNTNTADVHLTSFTFGWPDSNGSLKTVNFNGPFLSGELPPLPAGPPSFSAENLSGPRTLLKGKGPVIDFQVSFAQKSPLLTGYTLRATFDIGCTFNLSH